MKVICPKCQFENQADSSRVVCARCATIIEVRMDQGTGYDANGKRQTARLPFTTNTPQSGNQPLGSQSFGQNRDTYATRVGDDFDDVLDIPRPSQTSYPAEEASPMFEDVFATPTYDSTSPYDFSAYEKTPTTPIENFQTGAARQRETQDYTEAPEPEFMGWPVLPENSMDEEENAGGSRGGLLARVGLIVAVFGVLCALAYYFLGDFIANRKKQETNLASGNAATQTGAVTSSSPLAAPGTAVKPPDTGTAPTDNNAASQNSSISPPIITPKPQDSAPATGGKPGKEVVIPPIPAGRSGFSQTPKPAQSAAPNVPAAPNKGNLTVQVGSFNDQAQADERAASLKSKGVDARVVRADIAGKGTWYRVQVGGFASREEAMSYGSQIKSKGLAQDFIVTTIGK